MTGPENKIIYDPMRPLYVLTSACILGLALWGAWPKPARAQSTLQQDQTKAVILAYSHIGDDDALGDNLPADLFSEHLAEIEKGGYTVLPLPEILSAFKRGDKLPPRSLALTFDGAYAATYRNALRPLLEKKIPFTLFYASDPLDQKLPDYMSWTELQTLARSPQVTLGVLPSSQVPIAGFPRQAIIGALNKARQRYREMFGHEMDLLAYPFGAYGLALKDLAAAQGFKAAFGLHSGAAYAGADLYALPRFTMTENYGDLERFQMVAQALPLPVTDMEPQDTALGTGEWMLGFTLPEALAAESQNLSCFLSGQPAPHIERLGPRIELRSAAPLSEEPKIRLNCTMPGPASEDGTPRWRWLGLLFHRNQTARPEDPALNTPRQDELPALLE